MRAVGSPTTAPWGMLDTAMAMALPETESAIPVLAVSERTVVPWMQV